MMLKGSLLFHFKLSLIIMFYVMKIEKYFTLIDRTMVTIDGVGHVFQTIKYQVFCVVRLRVLFKITFIILRRFRGFFLNM